MKKLFTLFAIVTMFFVTGCQYDDSALTNRVDNLENRVETLEALCVQLNTNVSSLQTIVSALQTKDFITNVEPILKNGETIGWKISFTNNDPISIYNGADGADGNTPVIGVKKANDDIYYWTINGEWLYDADGNKVQAQATNGEDGTTPKFQINGKGYWEISYDNGETWAELGKATGADGSSSNAIFSDVTEDGSYVYFTLADGSVISVPMKTSLAITFDEEDLDNVSTNSEVLIGYTVTSVTKKVDIEVTSSSDLKATVIADDNTNLTGYIKVVTGDTIDEYSKVIVFVSNGEKVVMKSIVFTPQQGDDDNAHITIINGATKLAPADGGNITLDFISDVEFEAVISEADKSWISVISSRALQEHSITLKVEANTGSARSAIVKVQSTDGKYSVKYTISQQGTSSSEPSEDEPAPNEIWYTSSTNDVVILSNVAGFGAEIVSHGYSNGRGVIKFDKNISNVCNGAFRDCREITSVIIPEGVTTIGSNAFNQCNKLESVKLPKTLKNIEYYAFFNCSSIKSLELPEGTANIGTGAFKGCSSLTTMTIPGSINVLGQEAFHSCTYLKSVIVSDGVTEIGSQAFNGCRSMTKITIPESVTKIGDNAFNRTGLISVQLPSELTSIEDRTFYQCYDLKSVKVGDKITSIGEEAFALCDDLKKFETPSTVTTIKRRAFADCTNMASVIIPEGITEISFGTFQNCSSLAEVTFPSTLTTIKDEAFTNCSSITSIHIPTATLNIGNSVFMGCTKIASFTGNYATNDHSCLIIERSVIAFAPAGISEYTISEDADAISKNAFYGCTELTSVTLHSKITEIGDTAFADCSNLQTINSMPTTPPTIGSNIFDGISSNAKIYVPAKCGEAYVSAWRSYANMIEELPSTEPDEPEVTVANNKIFYTTSDGNVISIYEGNFGANEVSNAYADGKGVIEFDGDVTTIPASAFSGCSTLTSITLPNTVQIIDDRCFENCSSLATIAIPESVTAIGQAVFTGCASLESFTGKFASADGACLVIDSKLVAFATKHNPIYTIPSTVSTIAQNAFKDNKAIAAVTIPESVNAIETSAFMGCSSLKSITLLDTESAPKGASLMFEYIAPDAKIYVPAGTVDMYKAAWQSFGYNKLITEIANE